MIFPPRRSLPDMRGFSKTRLERVGDVLAGYARRGEVPGVVALLSRGGETHLAQAGDAEPDTIFRIASMTKPVAAAAALILVEECVLRLDDPVDDFLPELASRRVLTRLDAPLDSTVPAARPITVRDVLTFTLGLGFGQGMWGPPGTVPIMDALTALGQGMPAPAGVPGPDVWLRRLGELPLICQPGERWLYNTGSDVLGVLIARASGQPFEEFLRERIFAPLGMADTGFSVPPGSLGRLPPQYVTDPGSGDLVVYDPPDGQWAAPPAFPSGAGGLVSTIGDYAAFGAMLAGGGAHRGVRILSRPAVSLMTSDQLTDAQKAVSGLAPGDFDDMGWGFGVSVVTRRRSLYHSPGTYGWSGGLGTTWVNDPAEDLTLILLTQRGWTTSSPPAICRDFWTAAYQALDD
jgi:CubicO group peptidase (beta-lactamase class C family)